tara:strand:+ start:227 stop:415 length:189 start_codon:yes stop_codon:yes gene_type:complete
VIDGHGFDECSGFYSKNAKSSPTNVAAHYAYSLNTAWVLKASLHIRSSGVGFADDYIWRRKL